MAKKHKHPEHVNHERWLVSYADFITLLFAFFVVMFSTSQTDSNKVGRFSESFVESMGVHILQGSVGVFDGTNSPFSAVGPRNVKSLHNQKAKLTDIESQMQALQSMLQAAGSSPEAIAAALAGGPGDPKLRIALGAGASEESGNGKPMGPGGEKLGGEAAGAGEGGHAPEGAASASPAGKGAGDGPGAGDAGDVAKGGDPGAADEHGNPKERAAPLGFRILRRRSELVLRLDIDVLFKSGADELDPRATPLLEALGKELKAKPVLVKVEGHADNRPINTARYPSNWHLSSARATAVVLTLMQKAGIPASRLAAAGFGEHQPIASNDTEEGRAKNRRVDIVIGLDPTVEDVTPPKEAEGMVKGAAGKARDAAERAVEDAAAEERRSGDADRRRGDAPRKQPKSSRRGGDDGRLLPAEGTEPATGRPRKR
ncbi:MAG: OmpA family protein [Deltaproteobacteria bacterium]|nr:OmpA family protein [Deltaproteobacteria bacterium]